MSGRILPLDPTNHKAVQELLPWFAAKTLSDSERLLVQQHLLGCSQCQADLEWQRKLQAGEPLSFDAPGTAAAGSVTEAPDAERALAQLLPRLTAQTRAPKRSGFSDFLKNLLPGPDNGMRWAVAAQAVVIAGLSIVLAMPDRTSPDYRMLGAKKSAGGNVVVVFKPDTAERDLRRILHAVGARVVDGPTVTDAYLLEVADAQQRGAIDRLRSEPAVVLVESLSAGEPR